MSADKPEVGDVFAHPKTGSRRVVLSEITQYRWWCLLDSGGCVINYSYQFDNWDYIGKSIENVNNIFQTEQDVANNVAKPDLQHLQAENNRLKTTLKNLKSLMLDPDCVLDRGDIYVMVRAIDKALNGESEEK